jgi:hypothetical protein
MRIRGLAVALATAVCVTLVVHQASAQQVLVSGKVTDTWGNPLEGVQVVATQANSGGSPRSEITDADGEFQMIGLDTADYEFTYTLGGYQGIRQIRDIRTQYAPGRARRGPPPIELELLKSGKFLRDEHQFETEGGTHSLTLKADGMFEFEDPEGEGEGNYSIQDATAMLTVRDYDGPDDTFSIAEPVVVTAPNNGFLSVVWGETTLTKK